jgi:hypothetical protein
MPTISTPGYPDIEPVVIDGYTATRRANTIVHDSIDPARTNEYVTLLAAQRRSGTLVAVFDHQDKAIEALNRHALRLVFTIENPGAHVADMTYVVADGNLQIEVAESRKTWLVSIPFREIQL